jgi:hypothetical protein
VPATFAAGTSLIVYFLVVVVGGGVKLRFAAGGSTYSFGDAP